VSRLLWRGLRLRKGKDGGRDTNVAIALILAGDDGTLNKTVAEMASRKNLKVKLMGLADILDIVM
jgi:hypothetical protein